MLRIVGYSTEVPVSFVTNAVWMVLPITQGQYAALQLLLAHVVRPAAAEPRLQRKW